MIVGSLSFPVGFAWLRLARALYMVSAAPRISTKVDSWWIGLTKTRGLDRGAWHCKQRPGIHLHGHVEAGNINPPPPNKHPIDAANDYANTSALVASFLRELWLNSPCR